MNRCLSLLLLASWLGCGPTSGQDGPTGCEATATCQTPSSTPSSMPDSGTPSQPVACTGERICADKYTTSICQGGVTRKSPCQGATCLGGRCGGCTSDSGCQGISYRCKCADGTERTGVANSTCTDSQGTQRWCSPPNPGVDTLCAGHGGPDSQFGYLGLGCVSTVDP
jgi:hypothetical protein